jgi:hypothetical protein
VATPEHKRKKAATKRTRTTVGRKRAAARRKVAPPAPVKSIYDRLDQDKLMDLAAYAVNTADAAWRAKAVKPEFLEQVLEELKHQPPPNNIAVGLAEIVFCLGWAELATNQFSDQQGNMHDGDLQRAIRNAMHGPHAYGG